MLYVMYLNEAKHYVNIIAILNIVKIFCIDTVVRFEYIKVFSIMWGFIQLVSFV